MSQQPPWPVPITAVGPSAAATVAWQWRGQLHVTVIVKATFALAQGGPMAIAQPEPILQAEVHHRNNPSRSVSATSDLLPYLRRADVVLTGNAHAPPGQPAATVPVRLSVYRGHALLLDKPLHVLGDRDGAGEPKPFEAMPIIYERAFGGIGWAQNPLGTGIGGGKPPNVISPSDPGSTAGFGPVSRSWPERKKLLRGADPRPLNLRVAELPADLDWDYFQAAPIDQRIDFLKGDEWIVLEGLHPELPRYSSQLPGARAAARVHGLSGSEDDRGRLLDLQADTLRIDADAQRCTLVWRAIVPLRDASLLPGITAACGVSIEGMPLDLPDPSALHLMSSGGDARRGAEPSDMAETVVLKDHRAAAPEDPQAAVTDTTMLNDDEPASLPVVPFRPSLYGEPPARSPAPSAPIPGAPWSPVAATPAVPARDFSETTALPGSSDGFAPPRWSKEREEPAKPASAPAAAEPPESAAKPSVREEKPAPAAEKPAAAAPPKPAAPPPPPPAASPEKDRKRGPWAEPPPPLPEPPRAPPRPAPKATAKNEIYKGFGPRKK